MTLTDFIMSQSENQIIHAGSGSSFFFVGTPGEWKAVFLGINKNLRKDWIRSLEGKRADIKAMSELLIDPDFCEKQRKALAMKLHSKGLSEKQIANLETQLASENFEEEQRQNVLYALNRQMEMYFHDFTYLKNWQDIYCREVKDSYNRLNRDGIVALVDGEENGKYWSREEYLSGK